MDTLYTIYTAVLARRLGMESEEKGAIPQNQIGFRKGMGNIYVINYLINRQLERGKKVVAMFINFKAAFDSVDRGVLGEAIRGRRIGEGLIKRVKEVLKETRSRVKIGGEKGECFWTVRGQGCPLSPVLFNLLIVDLEEEMRRVKWGEIKLGKEKIYTLAYADEVVLAEEEDEMRSMISKLEEYVDKKRLELNVNKTKIVRFRRGGGKLGKKDWRWKGKKLEKVKEFRYLGYMLQRNGGARSTCKGKDKESGGSNG